MKRSSELESEPGLRMNAFTKNIKVGDIVDVVPKAGPWFPDEGGRARIESISSDGIAVNYLFRRGRGLISEHQFLVAVDKDDGDDDDDGGGEASPKRTTSEEPMVSPRRSSRAATVASTLSANKSISSRASLFRRTRGALAATAIMTMTTTTTGVEVPSQVKRQPRLWLQRHQLLQRRRIMDMIHPRKKNANIADS